MRIEQALLAGATVTAVETAWLLVPAGNRQLFVSLAPDPIYLEAEVTRPSQVLTNLWNHEREGHAGAIHLKAKHDAAEVIVLVREERYRYPCRISSSIFDLFSELSLSIVREEPGFYRVKSEAINRTLFFGGDSK